MNTTNGTVGAVEVILSWEGMALDSEVIAASSATMRLVVGPNEGSRFLLPGEIAGERGFELVEKIEDAFVVRIPAGAAAVITEDGAPVDVATLPLEASGERRLAIEPGHLAEVRMGDFTFFVRPMASKPEPTARAPWIDWSAARWVGAALAFHGALLAMLLASPPGASALSLDLSRDDVRYMQIQLDAIERETPPPAPSTGTEGPAAETGEPSPATAASAGGETVSDHVQGGPGRRAPGRRTVVGHTPTATDVLALGTLTTIASFSQIEGGTTDSPFGSDDLATGPGGPGRDLDAGGPGSLFGGLRLHDTSLGTCTGAHCSDHAVATGPLTTRDGSEIGDGHRADLHRDGPGRVPQIRNVETTTMGSLSREQIRRTIRNHIAEVRFCYEQSLQSRPDTEGRVAVRFVVSPNGQVTTSAVSTATPGTERVAGCVSSAVSRWTFPQSEGLTAVTYPFVLQSH